MPLPIIIAVLFVVGFAVCLHFYVRRTLRQWLQALSEAACPACGTPYGASAAERARQDYLDHCLESRRRNPHCAINFVRYWEIRCAQCGAEARFHFETESLVKYTA